MHETYPYLSDRIQSVFIDLLLIIVLIFFSANVLENYEDAPDWIRVALFFGLWAIYEPLFTSFGCTLGQYIKGIRVRKESDSTRKINFLAAFLRYVIKTLLGWVSFLTIHSSAKRRAIHDMAAGSVMIKLER